MKKSLIILSMMCALFIVFHTNSQNTDKEEYIIEFINGTVIDEEGNFVETVSVTIVDSELEVYTNERGEYRIDAPINLSTLPVIQFEKPGYTTVREIVKDTVVNCVLSRSYIGQE